MYGGRATHRRFDRLTQLPATVDRLEERRLFASATVVDTAGAGTNLVADAAGNIYFGSNASSAGRAAGIYELPGGAGPEKAVALFDATKAATQGSTLSGNLVIDGNGTLYGRTLAGGAHGNGTFFKVVAGSGTITPLASFDASTMSSYAPDLYTPGLARDAAGDLFCNVKGTIDPTTDVVPFGVAELPAGSTTIKLVATPDTYAAGNTPAGMEVDPSGNVFIPCLQTGQSNKTTIIKLAAGTFAQTVITLTADIGTGVNSIAIDPAGNLFGTAQQVLNTTLADVFEIPAGSTTPTVLATFDPSVSNQPEHVLLDGADNVFGIAFEGGTADEGTIFEVAVGSGTVKTLYSFGGDNVGFNPEGLLVADGALYGATGSGGVVNTLEEPGTIYTLPATVTPTTTPTPTPTPTPTGTSTLSAVIGTGSLAASIIAGAKARGAVHVAVSNASTSATDTLSSVALYATMSGIVDSASVKLGSAKKPASLKPAKSTGVTVPITELPTTPGTYTLLAVTTDRTGATSTSAASAQTLTVVPATVALAGTLVAPSPATAKAGKSFTLTLTLTNDGNTDSTGSATVVVTLTGTGGTFTLTPAIKGPKVKAGGKPSVVKMKLKVPVGTAAGAYTATVDFTQGVYSATVFGTSPLTVS